MPARVEVHVVGAAHLRDGSGDGAATAAAVAVRLHAVASRSSYPREKAKLEKLESALQPARLVGGASGAHQVVTFGAEPFYFTREIGPPEQLVVTFKVRDQSGADVGEASASLAGLQDAAPRAAWLALRESDGDSEAALNRGYLRVALLYVVTPRVALTVRDGGGWFGAAEGEGARVTVSALALSAGSPGAAAGQLLERLAARHTTRAAGGLPSPAWGQTFVVPEPAEPERLLLELEGRLAGGVSLGKARLSFGELPPAARCGATLLPQTAGRDGGGNTAADLEVQLRDGSEPDLVGLDAEDFEEAIGELSDPQVAETLQELR